MKLRRRRVSEDAPARDPMLDKLDRGCDRRNCTLSLSCPYRASTRGRKRARSCLHAAAFQNPRVNLIPAIEAAGSGLPFAHNNFQLLRTSPSG